MRVVVEEHRVYLDDEEDLKRKEALEFLAGWDKKFSAQFTNSMHKRVCEYSKGIYVVMREVCPILDYLLVEGEHDRYLTAEVRDKLAHMLRVIDGIEEAKHE